MKQSMFRKLALALLVTVMVAATPSNAQDRSAWGGFADLIGRVWTTTSEGQARTSSYSWEVPGELIVARHGTRARYESQGDPQFADTTQRLQLNRSTGAIEVTYTYSDFRPELRTRITVAADGTATETFLDATGIERRNIYLFSETGESLINREERRGGVWASLPTTRRRGQSTGEVAEEKMALVRQQTEYNAQLAHERQERALQDERNRIYRAEEDARVAQIISDGVARAAVIATGPVGMSYEEIMYEREIERQTLAAMNDPNNPLTQQQRREGEAREARHAEERADLQREHDQAEAREAEDREALARANTYGTRDDDQTQRDDEQADADQAASDREARERREAQRRARDDELRRQQEIEQQEQERQRRAQAEREAETRRQDQQRQRDAAEAERNRVIDFKEAVVLCELSGAQAQFGNWRCEGPLQMTYANLGQGNYASAFAQMDCSSFRELPRASTYRAFGCGYGLHPTNPGAGRNVPEMLDVFVAGRITFRCPRNISGVCRSQ